MNTRSQKHRIARLSAHPAGEDIGVHPIEADHNAILQGTVQHQILEGETVVAFLANDSLAITVDCRVDAGTLKEPVRYALAASLEVATTVQADLHAQVQQGLRQQAQQRQREQIATR